MPNFDIKTAKQKRMEEQDKTIRDDIAAIDAAIESDDENQMRGAHIMIDGKYSAYIHNFGMSTYWYNKAHGYVYDSLDKESLVHNLLLFRAKLSGCLSHFDFSENENTSGNSINVNVNNTNEISIHFSFDEARKKIDEMPGLNDAETEEIKGKIDELENISHEDIPKKKKWEKVKPILAFIMDKGADAAIAIMTLILQMKLGA